jgi:hypothetical protein
VWPVKHCLASRDIRVNRSNVPVAGGCTWAEPVKDFTDDVIYNGSELLIYVSSRLLTSPDPVWNRVISGADARSADRPLQWFVTLRHGCRGPKLLYRPDPRIRTLYKGRDRDGGDSGSPPKLHSAMTVMASKPCLTHDPPASPAVDGGPMR